MTSFIDRFPRRSFKFWSAVVGLGLGSQIVMLWALLGMLFTGRTVLIEPNTPLLVGEIMMVAMGIPLSFIGIATKRLGSD